MKIHGTALRRQGAAGPQGTSGDPHSCPGRVAGPSASPARPIRNVSCRGQHLSGAATMLAGGLEPKTLQAEAGVLLFPLLGWTVYLY